MTERHFNFAPGPSTLPLPVLQRVREELLDFQGMGTSLIEISHLSPEFKALLGETEDLLREVLEIPANYRISFAHGGASMQFAMAPMNLLGRRPSRRALYVNSGYFASAAIREARRHGTVEVIASSEDTGYDRIPELDPAQLHPDACYLHITTNNTMQGTRWHEIPDTGALPLVADVTSEICSRRLDISRFGLLYAGAQKNLGPSGVAVALLRDDLEGYALPHTPRMLNYTQLARDHSLTNTANTFSIYVMNLMLHWVRTSGGVAAMEALNEQKAATVYHALERPGGFYRLGAHPEHRSTQNVVFRSATAALDERFATEAEAEGLHALRGHRNVGGLRASLYNAMPLEGARALANFIEEFARRNG